MADHRKGASSERERTGINRVRERRITVLLIDNRSWTREALAHALEKSGRGVRVIRCGYISELKSVEPVSGTKLILLNATGASLAQQYVTSTLAETSAALPGVPVVLLSDNHDAHEILDAIECGLNGYVPISLELRSVVEALRFVAAGGTFIPAEPLLASLNTDSRPTPPAETAALPPPSGDKPELGRPALTELTARELAVLELLRQAKSNKHIARTLDLSEATVKVHVRHIMRKVGAVNRTQVALLAERLLS